MTVRWVAAAAAAIFPAMVCAQEATVPCDRDLEGPETFSDFYFVSACKQLPEGAEQPYEITQKVCASGDQNVWFEWMPLNFVSSFRGTGPRGCLYRRGESDFYSLRQDTSLRTSRGTYATDAYLPLLPSAGQVGGVYSETSREMTEEAGEASPFVLRIQIDIHSDGYATGSVEYDADSGAFVLVLPAEYDTLRALEEAGIVKAGGTEELARLFDDAAAVLRQIYGGEPVTLPPVINEAVPQDRSALVLPAEADPARIELVGEGADAFSRLMAFLDGALFCVVQDGFIACEGAPPVAQGL